MRGVQLLMQELETKIIHINVDTIKEKLNKINAAKVKMEKQINYIYDFPDKRLINSKGYARIRAVEDLLYNKSRCYMTTKKLLSQDKFRINEEHEIVISDCGEGIAIFLSLGLVENQVIHKYRESYKYKNTLIEIDINDKSFCPFPYLEIEAPSGEELMETVELLGYTMKDTTSKSIYELLKSEGVN